MTESSWLPNGQAGRRRSCVARQVAARIYERFGVQLTPHHLFDAKTVARLAAEVDSRLMQRLESLTLEELSQLPAR